MLTVLNSSHDPFYNQAFEEYVFEHFREGEIFLLWQNDPAVIVGSYQNICREVHVERLRQLGIPVIRRITGGIANWEKNQANVIVRQWMKEYPNQIEVIISNNDDMALGAWEALEEKGCTEVQVVGIDGIEEVRELVDEDKILGSVLCDTKLHAKALMQFIDVLAFHNGSVEKLNLENERLNSV